MKYKAILIDEYDSIPHFPPHLKSSMSVHQQMEIVPRLAPTQSEVTIAHVTLATH